tara:strand:- start:12727 stop:13608 length:882 start_codon:yes stop_codon:yes gene_type:complete
MKKFVTTIGNFDGVHLGHQALLKCIKDIATEKECLTKLITFNPYPFEFFDTKKRRISTEYDKDFFLKKIGIDTTVYCEFNKKFKDLSAEEFFNLYIKKETISLAVGRDFRFGKDRRSGVEALKKLCQENSIQFMVFEDFNINSTRVSSSQIRTELQLGNFGNVTSLLGRPYKISGKVNSGMKVGRTIQTPTANVEIDNQKFCFTGVFLCKIQLRNNVYFGIANFGSKPSFEDYKHSLEVNIFDFDDNIYGEVLCVEFLHKIRNQIKFSSLDNLKAQINEDQKLARDLIRDYEQ